LSGVCEYLDDSECSRPGALAEKANGKRFTGNYTFNIRSCESLWSVQARYEGENIKVNATIGGLKYAINSTQSISNASSI
jgi:hypothetical protein